MKFVAPTWESIFSQSVRLAEKLLHDWGPGGFDCIVGVSRGGLVLTRLMSDLLEIQDVMITKSEYYTDMGRRKKKPVITQKIQGNIFKKNVLLVDDVADTGESLIEIERYIESKKPKALTVATLYIKPWSKVVPDYYVSKTDAWIIFPWERFEAVKSLTMKTGKKILDQTGMPPYIVKRMLEFADRGLRDGIASRKRSAS
ncbi:MAG: phosphoribosyltransferase [Nitrososphaerales archaeon]